MIIDCESIEQQAEFKINNENNYHLLNLKLDVLHLHYENNIYITDSIIFVMGKRANTSTYGNPHQRERR